MTSTARAQLVRDAAALLSRFADEDETLAGVERGDLHSETQRREFSAAIRKAAQTSRGRG